MKKGGEAAIKMRRKREATTTNPGIEVIGKKVPVLKISVEFELDCASVLIEAIGGG